MEINTDKIAEDCIKAINEKIKNLKSNTKSMIRYCL